MPTRRSRRRSRGKSRRRSRTRSKSAREASYLPYVIGGGALVGAGSLAYVLNRRRRRRRRRRRSATPPEILHDREDPLLDKPLLPWEWDEKKESRQLTRQFIKRDIERQVNRGYGRSNFSKRQMEHWDFVSTVPSSSWHPNDSLKIKRINRMLAKNTKRAKKSRSRSKRR